MTQPILLAGNTYGITVPEGATQIEVLPDECGDKAVACKGTRTLAENDYDIIATLPGNWQLICMARDITEAKAKEFVRSSVWHFPEIHTRYVDYKYPFDRENKQRWGEGFGTAIESFRSLLTSKKLNPETTLLIKKVG